MINIYSLEQIEEWKNIVNSFKNADIYYLPEYVDAFMKNGDGIPLLIHYTENNIEAINVVFKRDISDIPKYSDSVKKNTIFDFISPYGYGGILFKDNYSLEIRKKFVHEYINFFREKNVISEFIRFSPILNNHNQLTSLIDISTIGPTVSIETHNFEESWGTFSSKNRNVIRKSRKNGVIVEWGYSNNLMQVFKKMYFDTMQRDNASVYYYFSDAFFDSIMDKLRYKMQFFYARLDEQIISISMFLMHDKRIHYHLSASNEMYRNLAPTNLLLSEVVRFGCENGYHSVHLGGGVGGKIDSLYKFKKSFNPIYDNEYCVGKVIFNNIIYAELTNGFDDGDFFPAYRK